MLRPNEDAAADVEVRICLVVSKWFVAIHKKITIFIFFYYCFGVNRRHSLKRKETNNPLHF